MAVEDEEVAEEDGLEAIFILGNIPFVEYYCVFGILQNFGSFAVVFGILSEYREFGSCSQS